MLHEAFHFSIFAFHDDSCSYTEKIRILSSINFELGLAKLARTGLEARLGDGVGM